MIRLLRPQDLEPARALLAADGWENRVGDLSRFERMVLGTARVMVAESDGQLIGFGRAVTDGASNGYLSMLVIHPDHRRRGLGGQLVEALMGDEPEITWVLRAGTGRSEARAFWRAVGFSDSSIAMERVRPSDLRAG